MDIAQNYRRLFSHPLVQQGMKFIESDNDHTTADQVEITEIPAPPFNEQRRADYYRRRLQDLGVQNVQMDEEGNVFGVRPGVGHGPTVFVSAHLDTVFPGETNTKVTEKDGIYYAPGISDDGRGLAALLSLVRAFNHVNPRTIGTILFGATVGEEGLGDLRGVKAFFRDLSEHPVDAFISIEPGHPSRITYLATGSHRYRVTYIGPGGHSFGNFGTPSAIHALGRAIAGIADVQAPSNPKTTFTVGEIVGGTSVNTIAANASMMIDIRSNSHEELLKLEQRILDIIHQAVAEENRRWDSESIQVEVELVGDRPAGSQSELSPIVEAACGSIQAMGFHPKLEDPSSTDSNVPISLGIPSLTLGGGGDYGRVHTLGEYFNPKDAHYGVQNLFLTVLGLVGLEGVCGPLLEKHIR